jgi:hypothetical protein
MFNIQLRVITAAAALVVAASACSSPAGEPQQQPTLPDQPSSATLTRTVVLSSRSNPWDIAFAEPVNENETFERKVYEGMRTIAV